MRRRRTSSTLKKHFLMVHWRQNGWTKYSTWLKNVLNLRRPPTRQSTLVSIWTQAQRSRPRGASETTFQKILDELLSEKNFLLDQDIAGTRMIVPKWEYSLEYEYQVRRQAIKLCVRKGLQLQDATAGARILCVVCNVHVFWATSPGSEGNALRGETVWAKLRCSTSLRRTE